MREENDGVEALIAGEDAPFVLDTTMAVVRRRDGEGRALLTLISPVKCDDATLNHIKVGSDLVIIDHNTDPDLHDLNTSVL